MDEMNKPASRVEAILQRMLGADINIEKPASRVEFLLSNVKDLLLAVEDEIEKLEGKTTRLLYSDKPNPTAQEIDAFAIEKGYESPYEGVAIVVAGTYHIWHYYENDSIGWRDDGVDTITPFTNSVPGSILGSADDGKISANPDGTGSVNGWSDKLDKQSGESSYPQVYAKLQGGGQDMANYSTNVMAYHIVQRIAGGQIPVPETPTANAYATSKKYVDNKLTATLTQLSDGTYSLTFGV